MSFDPIDMPSKYSRYWSASSALVGSSHIMMCFRPFSPRFRPLSASSWVTALRLAQGAHERHHDLHIGQPHLVAHALQGAAFELEAGPEYLVDIARRAAKPQHRIFLVRLVVLAADQIGVLIRLEIRQAHDHRLGRKCGGDLRDAFGQLVDVEIYRSVVAGDLLADGVLDLGALLVEFQQRARMHADHAVDDELEARKAHALVRNAREIESAVRIADVHRDFHRNRRHGIHFDGALIELEHAVVDVAGIALGAGHGDRPGPP